MPVWRPYCTATVTSVSQVMSTWSPTLSLSSPVGSTTRRLYFHPFGPVKVIDGALLSISVMVAVMVLTMAAVRPGRSPCPAVVVPVAVLTGGSPGGFSLAETVQDARWQVRDGRRAPSREAVR